MNASWQFHIAVAIGASLVSVAGAQEKKIERSDLPAGVKRTVVEQSQGATILGFSEEKENGETRYEAQLMVNGHSKDVLMDGNGAKSRSPSSLCPQLCGAGCRLKPA